MSAYLDRFTSFEIVSALIADIQTIGHPTSRLSLVLSSYATKKLGKYADLTNTIPVDDSDVPSASRRRAVTYQDLPRDVRRWTQPLIWDRSEISMLSLKNMPETESDSATLNYLLSLSNDWASGSVPSEPAYYKRVSPDLLFRLTTHKSYTFAKQALSRRIRGAAAGVYPQKAPSLLLHVASIWNSSKRKWVLLGVFLSPLADVRKWADSPKVADDAYESISGGKMGPKAGLAVGAGAGAGAGLAGAGTVAAVQKAPSVNLHKHQNLISSNDSVENPPYTGYAEESPVKKTSSFTARSISGTSLEHAQNLSLHDKTSVHEGYPAHEHSNAEPLELENRQIEMRNDDISEDSRNWSAGEKSAWESNETPNMSTQNLSSVKSPSIQSSHRQVTLEDYDDAEWKAANSYVPPSPKLPTPISGSFKSISRPASIYSTKEAAMPALGVAAGATGAADLKSLKSLSRTSSLLSHRSPDELTTYENPSRAPSSRHSVLMNSNPQMSRAEKSFSRASSRTSSIQHSRSSSLQSSVYPLPITGTPLQSRSRAGSVASTQQFDDTQSLTRSGSNISSQRAGVIKPTNPSGSATSSQRFDDIRSITRSGSLASHRTSSSYASSLNRSFSVSSRSDYSKRPSVISRAQSVMLDNSDLQMGGENFRGQDVYHPPSNEVMSHIPEAAAVGGTTGLLGAETSKIVPDRENAKTPKLIWPGGFPSPPLTAVESTKAVPQNELLVSPKIQDPMQAHSQIPNGQQKSFSSQYVTESMKSHSPTLLSRVSSYRESEPRIISDHISQNSQYSQRSMPSGDVNYSSGNPAVTDQLVNSMRELFALAKSENIDATKFMDIALRATRLS